MNRIKAQYIAGVKSLSDEALLQALKAIAILFEVCEDHVRAEAMENNGPVWEDSCVEFFVQAPDGKHYTNFEMNCAGTMLAALRTSRHDPVKFNNEQFAPIRRITSLPHELIDSRAEGQSWWAMEVIPFESFGLPETK